MRPVLFYVPLHLLSESLPDLPVYGYGMMLFLAFVLCSWLAGRLCKREGIDPAAVLDLGVWMFVSGLIGARLTYVIQEWNTKFVSPDGTPRFFAMLAVWDGGLVFYGSVFGALIGYALAYRSFLGKMNVPTLKMADVLAPCIALGLALGRVGCLLSGCCYGNVACENCPAIAFPFGSEASRHAYRFGYEAPGGFLVNRGDMTVLVVQPDSPAQAAGLRPGDRIVGVNGADVSRDQDFEAEGKKAVFSRFDQFASALFSGSGDSRGSVSLTVMRGGSAVNLPPIALKNFSLHPTQIYETISMVLLMFFLLSYYPFKTRDGSVMVFLMVGYAVHRFLNEMLRVDNDVVALGMTFSQLVSILVLVAAGILAYFVWRPGSAVATPSNPVETAAGW
jgi:phosphatidylglycerol---prolipoprotein diacylglyceryl transferase